MEKRTILAVVLSVFACYIGFDNLDGQWYNGDMDEVAIWPRALTPAEVKYLYTRQTQ